MDFISSILLSRSKGRVYNILLVIINRYTEFVLYFLVTKKLTAIELVDILVDKVVSKYRSSKGIILDRDIRFTSTFWSKLYYYIIIKRYLSTAFYP